MSDSKKSQNPNLSWASSNCAEFHRLLFDSATDGIFISDPQGCFMDVNPQGVELTGYSREELLGMKVTDLISPEDLARDPLALDELQQRRPVLKEHRIHCKDGGVLPVEISLHRLPDGNLLGMVRDISVRMAASALSEQRARELAALQTFGLAASISLSVDQITMSALRGMLEAVQADLAFLFLREGERLTLKAVLPPEAHRWLGEVPEHKVGQCVCGLAVLQGRPLYSHDIHHDSRCTWDECKLAGIRSFAAIPLRNGEEECIGSFGMASLTERDFATQAGFLETLAYQVSVSLANVRLYEAARREVAERQRAEAAQARLIAILEQTSDFVATATPDAKLTYINQAARELLGWQKDESHEDLMIHETHPAWAFEKVLREGLPTAAAAGIWEGETAILRRDGREIPVSQVILSHRSPKGEIQYYSTIMRNISERKRAEMELRESEERLRSIINSAPFGAHLYELRDNDRLVFIGYNSSANRILGVDNAQFVGKSIEEAFPPLAETDIPSRYKRTALMGHGFDGEQVAYKHGEIHGAFEVHAFQTGPRRMAAFFIDITERKRAAAEKEKLQAQLLQAQKMESVGRLAGGVAHDFNNMLSAILGYAQLAMMRCEATDPIHGDLKVIEEAAKRSADLTRQLLAFARKQTVAPKVLDLNDTVAGMLKVLRRLIGEDIDLVWKPGANLWSIKIDPPRLINCWRIFVSMPGTPSRGWARSSSSRRTRFLMKSTAPCTLGLPAGSMSNSP